MHNRGAKIAERRSVRADAALAEATRSLARAGIESARLDAEVLLAHVLEKPRLSFYSDPDQPLEPQQGSRYGGLLARRCRREPLAYLTGEKEFFSLPFEVDRSVLIPRPETERVVEAALEVLRPIAREDRTPTFIDVGTGSGAIAVAILANLPRGRAIATDVSAAARAVARRNAERHHVAERLTLLEGDLFAGHSGEVDLVVSNPPYVGEGDRERLAPEVRDYEPPEALFADRDGLSVIRRLVEEAPAHLPPGGRLILEFGHNQKAPVHGLLESAGAWRQIQIRDDLAGIPRVAIARKR